MGLSVDIQARVRGTVECLSELPGGESAPLVINPRGDLSIARALPEYAENGRLRNGYYVMQQTAVAPVVALPTTTAQVTLFNGELDMGKTYFVTHVGAFCAVSAAAATELAVLGCMGQGKKATVVSDITPKGLAGQRYKGMGLVDLAATVTNDTWSAIVGSIGNAPASQIGMNVEREIGGLIVIPPGHYFSIAVVANTVTTITVRQYIRWFEIQCPVAP